MKLEHVTYTNYPAVQFLLRRGTFVVLTVALLPLFAATFALFGGAPLWIIAIGLICGALAGLFVQAFVELIRIIADFLLPR